MGIGYAVIHFAYSLRPGTGSTDPAVGDIGEVYIGDVGFASWEEMNICQSTGYQFWLADL